MPPALALGLCIIWILVLAIPGGLLLFMITFAPAFITWPWWAIGLIVAVVCYAVRHRSLIVTAKTLLFRWALCGSVLASTIGLGLLVRYPSVADSPASTASRWVDFVFYRHEVDAMVRAQHGAGQRPALAVIAIDGFVTMVHGIAYDESGEMALPAGKQSPRWRAAAAQTELNDDHWGAMRMYGNYFWWDSQ